MPDANHDDVQGTPAAATVTESVQELARAAAEAATHDAADQARRGVESAMAAQARAAASWADAAQRLVDLWAEGVRDGVDVAERVVSTRSPAELTDLHAAVWRRSAGRSAAGVQAVGTAAIESAGAAMAAVAESLDRVAAAGRS